MKPTVIILIGTRPEAVKMAPVVHALHQQADAMHTLVLSTGQHKEMLDQTLADFNLRPDISLGLMTAHQSLAGLSSQLFSSIGTVLEREKPDMVLVQGDTTTVMVASLCAFYAHIPCGHVEAGLRSHNMYAPFPEELNRRIAALTAKLHFSPTPSAVAALRAEGVPAHSIHLTGNTGIDALLWTTQDIQDSPPILPANVQFLIDNNLPFVLVTGHRRESFGLGFASICKALRTLAWLHPHIVFLYPVHLNPNVRNMVFKELGMCSNIVLIDPLPYRQFVRVMQAAYCVLTDSGGIQEEAPSLKKPVLVMRDVTERPEGVEAGCSRLVGTNEEAIVSGVSALLTNTDECYSLMCAKENPYGDGEAAKRIAQILRTYFQI